MEPMNVDAFNLCIDNTAKRRSKFLEANDKIVGHLKDVLNLVPISWHARNSRYWSYQDMTYRDSLAVLIDNDVALVQARLLVAKLRREIQRYELANMED